MRNRKQTGRPRKKVTFMKRRQLRHSSCPPEDFDAILEEAVCETASSLEKPTNEAAAEEAAEAAPAGDGHRRKFRDRAAKVKLPAIAASPSPPRLQQQQQPKTKADDRAPSTTSTQGAEQDAVTSTTSHTLLAIPAAAASAATAVAGKLGQQQCRRQAFEQRVLLTQRRPLVDAVDNKAVVEQMMQRLSDMLRTLHPPSGGATATEDEAAVTIAASPSPDARLLAHCHRAQIPERYRQVLRHLVAGSRQQRGQGGDRRRSDWEKKLLYEK